MLNTPNKNKQHSLYYTLNISTSKQKNVSWKQVDRNELINLFSNRGLTESKINNALRGNKEYGRITLSNDEEDDNVNTTYLYISKINSPALLTIKEERLLFDKWIANNYDRVLKKLQSTNNKTGKDDRVDESLVYDCFTDAIIYLLENVDKGKSVNDFETMLTFKTNYLIKDELKSIKAVYSELVENIYNEKQIIDGKEVIPEYIMFNNIRVRSYNDSECSNNDQSVVEIAENSLTDGKLEFFIEETCISSSNIQLKDDIIFQVLRGMFDDKIVDVYLEYLKLSGNKNDKVKQLALTFKVTLSQIKRWLNEIDNVIYNKTNGVSVDNIDTQRESNELKINELRSAINSLFELNRYRGVEDYELSDIVG